MPWSGIFSVQSFSQIQGATMPKNKISDPITDQEIAFARLVLSGAMTDRHAAEAVGLNPDSAAYTKSKPRVRAYMLQHRAAVQQQLVQQEADGLRRLNLDREQVLDRLWQIANLSPEMTRGSITGQVKALSMIVAMLNFIPDRLAVSAENKSAPPPAPAQILTSAWRQPATTIDPQPSPAQQEDSPARPACPALCSPIQFCSRLGSSFLDKEPLCPPSLSRQSAKGPKNIKFYKCPNRLRKNSLDEGHGFRVCVRTSELGRSGL
jgi:hypothetical protein